MITNTLITNKKNKTTALLFLFFSLLTVAYATDSSMSVLPDSTNIKAQSGIPVIANNDAIVTHKMHPYEANIMINDYGLSDGVSSLTIIESPINGTAEPTGKNTIIYTPNIYFTGDDYFEYQICNTYGNCDIASVFVTVLDYDFQPVAINDTVFIFQGSYTTIDVLRNDLYLYDLPISLGIVTNFNHVKGEVSNNQISIIADQFFMDMDSMVYEVCDREGDCDRATLFIKLVDNNENQIFIPQGFSPDGDGINDTFVIPEFEQYSDITINIFNRHGVMVYENKQYNNNWNGYSNTGPFNGKLLPTGVYYYAVRITGLKKQITGFVYLSR